MIGENEKLIECCLHDTMRNLDWCEKNCARYYKCDAVTAALAEESEDSVNTADNVAIQNIQNIENKYGLIIFRMGLSHLCDFGHRNLTDENVEKSIQQIIAQGNGDKAEISLLTPEFLCEVVRCAAELSGYSIWTLFAYIKKYVHVDII